MTWKGRLTFQMETLTSRAASWGQTHLLPLSAISFTAAGRNRWSGEAEAEAQLVPAAAHGPEKQPRSSSRGAGTKDLRRLPSLTAVHAPLGRPRRRHGRGKEKRWLLGSRTQPATGAKRQAGGASSCSAHVGNVLVTPTRITVGSSGITFLSLGKGIIPSLQRQNKKLLPRRRN